MPNRVKGLERLDKEIKKKSLKGIERLGFEDWTEQLKDEKIKRREVLVRARKNISRGQGREKNSRSKKRGSSTMKFRKRVQSAKERKDVL
jgi:hypothetical protein